MIKSLEAREEVTSLSEEIACRLVSDIARNKSTTVREVADKTVARPIQIHEEVDDKSAPLFNVQFLHKMCTSK